MSYIILKTKDILVTFSGCDYAYFTSKIKQVVCYTKFTSRELVYCENAVKFLRVFFFFFFFFFIIYLLTS